MAPRRGRSGGVNKAPQRMKTRAQTRQQEEALRHKLNDLHTQLSDNTAKRAALESQLKEVEQRLRNPDITNQAENEAQLKALFDQLNQLTEKAEVIQSQITAAEEEQHGSEMDVDQGLGADPPDFAQTREDNVPVDDGDDHSTPDHYADLRPVDIDLTGDDGAEGRTLDGGITLVTNKAGKGPIYLNSYGPRSCAVTVWENAQADQTVERLTNLRGNPHKKALETNDEGDLIHKGKIGRILNVAWKPKRKIQTIEDLLDSVEELNPENKLRDPKYRYPFSTVLVEWKDGLGRTWINRSNYKALSSQSKASTERTDRKFYQTGLLQVRRYREFLGGDRRSLGDLERTPPGLTESPEPGESSVVRGETASPPANNDLQGRGESGGPASGQAGRVHGARNEGGRNPPSDPSSGLASQGPGSQTSRGQIPGSQNTGSQDPASQPQDHQLSSDQTRGGQTQGSPSPSTNSGLRTMRSFYAEWLRENSLDVNTDVSTLGDERFGRFKAAAHAYADEYEHKFGQRPQDDMGILTR
ncbi:hypothetical protein NYO67_4572 [Aspergillus flavus]|nr:hypothetical protein NYO67_4572 [Aspergillus flavus]